MQDDLISRRAALDVLSYCGGITVREAREEIMALPAVDAQPMRHGEWIKEKLVGYEPYYLCSLCHKLHHQNYNFCSNCGAKMDGGE